MAVVWRIRDRLAGANRVRSIEPTGAKSVLLISKVRPERVWRVNLIDMLRGIDRRGQKAGTLSRNEPRNAVNASNFTPSDSRPDSMFDCTRGLRSNYTRFSRVRSAKELTFSRSSTVRNLFPTRPTNPARLLLSYREIFLIDRGSFNSFVEKYSFL